MMGTCASCAGHSGQMHGMYGYVDSQMKTESDTIQSKTDPGLGHEQHQLAVILPPSDKMYKGVLTYSASENEHLLINKTRWEHGCLQEMH
jgi:hypothetical protein